MGMVSLELRLEFDLKLAFWMSDRDNGKSWLCSWRCLVLGTRIHAVLIHGTIFVNRARDKCQHQAQTQKPMLGLQNDSSQPIHLLGSGKSSLCPREVN